MLGWIIGALLGAAAITAIIIVVSGIIDKQKIQDKMREQGVSDALVEKINNCENVVRLKDLDSDQTYEIQGDDVSYSLYEGQVITV